ncbi:hypothetical protein WLZ34_06485 [Thermogladius sp. KZ2Tp1]|uniref:hypothetical protein n=1 Tax=Thermogladius sp. KZ2Tp1 TaxID=3136289 RepID=UPI003DA8D48F
MSPSSVYDRVRAFLDKYGDKGFLVLKAALEVAGDPNVDHRYGDFSFKHLVLKLARLGFNYNPVNLLRSLEKEYGVVEKSYTSSNQTWWRFVDVEAVKSAVYEGAADSDDPRLALLKLKYESLEPARVRSTLLKLASKPSLSNVDKELFRSVVFNELTKLVELYYEMSNYEEYFAAQLSEVRELLRLAELVSAKMSKDKLPGEGKLRQEETLRAFGLHDNT